VEIQVFEVEERDITICTGRGRETGDYKTITINSNIVFM